MTIKKKHTLWRGTAGMLHVLPRLFGGWGWRDGPPGLVGLGLGPAGLTEGLKFDVFLCPLGLSAVVGFLVGLLGDGDKWPHGPVSACRNLK